MIALRDRNALPKFYVSDKVKQRVEWIEQKGRNSPAAHQVIRRVRRTSARAAA